MRLMKSTEELVEEEESELLFINRTIEMLQETEENIACWSVDGSSFYILNQGIFEKFIMERFYKHRGFSSFLRQLVCFGFKRIQQHQATINFGVKCHGKGRTYQFEHPLLRQYESPDLLMKRRLYNTYGVNSGLVSSTTAVHIRRDLNIEEILQLEKERVQEVAAQARRCCV
jgi:hypothetical protein